MHKAMGGSKYTFIFPKYHTEKHASSTELNTQIPASSMTLSAPYDDEIF